LVSLPLALDLQLHLPASTVSYCDIKRFTSKSNSSSAFWSEDHAVKYHRGGLRGQVWRAASSRARKIPTLVDCTDMCSSDWWLRPDQHGRSADSQIISVIHLLPCIHYGRFLLFCYGKLLQRNQTWNRHQTCVNVSYLLLLSLSCVYFPPVLWTDG
jgi:hypothetical protein